MIPTTSNNNINYFAALDDDSDDDSLGDTDTNADQQQANHVAINELRLHGENSALSDS